MLPSCHRCRQPLATVHVEEQPFVHTVDYAWTEGEPGEEPGYQSYWQVFGEIAKRYRRTVQCFNCLAPLNKVNLAWFNEHERL